MVRKTWIIMAISFFISCKKPLNDATMNIHAYNVLDNSGVDSIFVSVTKQPSGDVGKTKKMASGYTDTNGNLTLIYSKTKLTRNFRTVVHNFNNKYEIVQKYLDGDEWNGDGQIGGGAKEIDLDVKCVPKCNYKLRLLNTNCFNSNDTLRLNYENKVTGETSEIKYYILGVGFQNYSATGCFDVINSDFLPTNAGNHRYYGYIKRDNGTFYVDTTVYYSPWQDNLIELYF